MKTQNPITRNCFCIIGALLLSIFGGVSISYSFYTTDCSGNFGVKTVYDKNDPVCISGQAWTKINWLDLVPCADVYIVNNSVWSGGEGLSDAMGSENRICNEMMGGFLDAVIALPPLPVGRYDIIMDENADGKYNGDQILGAGTDYAFEVIDLGHPPVDSSALKNAAYGISQGFTDAIQQWQNTCDALDALGAAMSLMSGDVFGAAIGLVGHFTGVATDYNGAVINQATALIGAFDKNANPQKASGIYGTAAKHWYDLYEDPPDANFTVLAPLDFAAMNLELAAKSVDGSYPFQVKGSDAREAVLIKVANRSIEQAALVKALRQSFEKYQGAAAVSNYEYAFRQLEQGRQYGLWLEGNLGALKNDLQDVKTVFNWYGKADKVISVADLQVLKDRMIATGLTAEEEQSLKNVGFSDARIQLFIQYMKSVDVPAADFSLSSSIASMTTRIDGAITGVQSFNANALETMANLVSEFTLHHPLADAGGPYIGVAGTQISLNGGSSSDPDVGDLLTYEWDLNGDGVFGDVAGKNPLNIWIKPFSGLIGLKVTDSTGRSSIAYAQAIISAGNAPPVITSFAPVATSLSASILQPLTFTVAATDPDTDPLTYEWTVDGVSSGTGVSYTLTPSAAEIGNRIVLVTVRDNNSASRDAVEGRSVRIYADADGDNYDSSVDCNDSDATVNPGQTEILNNGKDDDCNAATADFVCGGLQPTTYYRDADSDGFGNTAITIQDCSAPAGYVADNSDCNDADAAVHPGAVELCNGKDDNCNGHIDEGVTLPFFLDSDGDGYGAPTSVVQACMAPTGHVAAGTDCNDANASINPGVAEIQYDGIDNDCNPATLDGIDADSDGYTANVDCNDNDPSINPGRKEIRHNGKDDDCNAATSDSWAKSFVIGSDDSSYLYYAKSNGDGTFSNYKNLGQYSTSYGRGVIIEDFNGDGSLDFIAGSSNGSFYLFLNDGTDTFSNTGVVANHSYGSYVIGMGAGDFNHDGLMDFVANGSSTAINVFINDGLGGFTRSVITGTGVGRGLDVADFNGDGNLDFMRVANTTGVWLYAGNGDGTFTGLSIGTVATTDNYALAAADFDNDGTVDAIVGGNSNGNPYFLKGNGNGTFQAATLISSLDTTTYNAIAAYDLNSDGNVDIVMANYSGRDLLFYPGAGDGTFGTPVSISTSDTSASILAVSAPPKGHPAGYPSADAQPDAVTVGVGEPALLNGRYSFDANGSISAYDWRFGDGSSATGDTVTHAYAVEGMFGAALKVTDDDGRKDTDVSRVKVVGAPPVANTGGPYTFGESYATLGLFTVPLNGTGSSDDSAIVRYEWDFGKLLIDSFAGTTLDTTTWVASTGVTQNEAASITGSNSWGARYLFTQTIFQREDGLSFEIKVKTGTAATSQGMFGVKNTTTSYTYSQLQNAFYFNNGEISIYEAGTSRGVVATYTPGAEYDLKLVMKSAGADYHLRASGTTAWKLLYSSTYSTQPTLRFGATILNDTFAVDDVTSQVILTGASPSKKLPLGTVNVTLTVADTVGQKSSASTTISTISGAPPVATTGGPYTFGENVVYQNRWTAVLDGSGSTDDAGIATYSWDFGDGSVLSASAKPTHLYTGPGPYTATLTVTDNVGQTNTASTTVTLSGNELPVARAGGPFIVPETSVVNKHWSISVDASASTDDYGIWKYAWNFGDGTAVVTTRTATHNYAALGSYTVTLTVTDNANQTHTDTTTASISGTPPAAEAGGPYITEPNNAIYLDGSGSSDDIGIVSYLWDFGDGTVGKGAKPEHTYTAPGTYTVSLTVTDQTLQSATDNATVIVAAGSPPVANAGGPYTTNVDLSFRLNGTGSTDDSGIVSYVWTVGAPTTVLQDSFDGTVIDAAKWLYNPVTGLTQNNAIISTGSATWGTRYLFSNYTYDARGAMELQGQVTSTASGNMMIGFKNSTTTYSYTAMPYAVYFSSGTFDVFEDNNNRTITAPVPTYALNTVYDVKIVLKENATRGIAGALYYYKPATAQDWNLLYDSNYVTTATTLKAGVVFSTGTYTVDNLQLSVGLQRATGARPVLSFDLPGTFPVQLTVTDGAGQTSSAATTLTVSPDPAVVTVPWQFSGGIEVPHDTWSGEEVILKAVVKSRRPPLAYTWDFGDGETATGTVANKYDVSARHTYTAADGTPIVARLTVTDADGRSSSDIFPIIMRSKTLDVEVNKSIEDALWYLHLNQDRGGAALDGSWAYGSYEASPTASSIHAMEINGHLEVGDFSNDPYTEDVWRGMRFMLNVIRQAAITDQSYGDPDINGNGIGIEVTETQPIYQGGQVMMALVASSTPDMKAETGGAGIKGRSYRQIVEDMADMYYWGQVDSGTASGGWQYSWNNGSDNSACQWAALGFEAAEEQGWIKVPQWVKDRNMVWLDYSNATNGIGYGYSGPGNGLATSPSGLAQLAFNGIPTSDNRWKPTENNLAQNWDSWYNGSGNYYAHYALAKAMRIAKPKEITILGEGTASAIDWYNDPTRGVARTIVNQQDANGQFVGGSGSQYVTGEFKTAWGVIILTKTLFVLPPVAIAGDNKVWGVDWELPFDGSKSYHLDPFRKIVKYEWDFDGDGVYDSVSDQPTAVYTYTSTDYPVSTLPKTFAVTLRVSDNNDPPKYDTDTVSIIIAEPPHPPVAVPGGPYSGYVGIPLTLDGSRSYDIDPGDVITAYGWEIDGVYPYTFADATGATPAYTFAQPGTYNIGLQVFDNGVLSPGDAKLSDTRWTTVTIRLNNPPVANPGGPYTLDEGSSITLDAGGSIDPDGNPLTYVWDLDNDGTYETVGDKPTFSRLDNGIFTVTLKVSDGGLDAIASTTVTVLNAAPTVNGLSPVTINEGSTYSANGFFTDPGVADTWSATVDYGIGAGAQPLTLSGKTFSLSYRYPQNGSYTITVRVTDKDGGTGTDTAQITVNNVAPVVNAGPDASLTDTRLYAGNGFFTDPGVDDTWTATIDYGDGSGAQTVALNPDKTFTLAHTYATNGNFVVTVAVKDSDNATGTDTAIVHINNKAPEVNAGPDATAHEGGTFSGSGSFTDPSSTSWSATVNYGDGSATQALVLNADKTFTLGHVYGQNGNYTVTVNISDSESATGSDTAVVTVSNVAPTVNAGPDVTLIDTRSFISSGSFTDPGTLDTWTATVNYGDGNGAQVLALNPDKTFALNHLYTTNGSFTVTVAVTDSDGATGSDTAVVHINNQSPVVNAGPDAAIVEGGTFSGSGAFTDPSSTAWTATVNYGDGSATQVLVLKTDKTFTLGHVYGQNGNYTVTVNISDSEGATGSDTAIVAVSNVAPTVNAGPDSAIIAGSSFISNGSFTDPGTLDTWTATVNYGDGTGAQALVLNPDKTFSLNHLYATNGSFTITVTVTDSDGATGSDNAVAYINNQAPAVDAGPDAAIVEGGTFSGSGAFTDPSSTVWTATVNYGDGSGVQPLALNADKTFSLNHTYGQDGNYTVTVSISDGDGAVGTDTALITVGNVAPTVNAGPDATIIAGSSFNSNGSFVDPGADTWSATVDYGDSSGVQPLALNADKTFSLSHTYASEGTYTTTVTVQDNYSGSGSDTAVVTVNAATVPVCLNTISARAKTGMVQLNWAAAEHTPTTQYDIYRSSEGPNSGFSKIRSGYVNKYALFLDSGLTNGITYYYRVEKSLAPAASGYCSSKVVSGKPMGL